MRTGGAATAVLAAIIAGVVLSACGSGPAGLVSRSGTRANVSTTSAAPPTTTTTILSVPPAATEQLGAYMANESRAYAAAAPKAGYSAQFVSVHSAPVLDDRSVVAVAAFDYDPGGHPIQVLQYTNGQWSERAGLGSASDPRETSTSTQWQFLDPSASVSVAEVTGDGRPDFLVLYAGADTDFGAIVSEAGDTPSWRFVPFTGPYPTSNSVGRNPRFVGNTFDTDFNNCMPDCAGGHVSTVTWTYRSSSGVFWAPDPPGWKAPTGAANAA